MTVIPKPCTMPEEIWCHPIWGGNFAFTLFRTAISKKDTKYIRADLVEKMGDE